MLKFSNPNHSNSISIEKHSIGVKTGFPSLLVYKVHSTHRTKSAKQLISAINTLPIKMTIFSSLPNLKVTAFLTLWYPCQQPHFSQLSANTLHLCNSLPLSLTPEKGNISPMIAVLSPLFAPALRLFLASSCSAPTSHHFRQKSKHNGQNLSFNSQS